MVAGVGVGWMLAAAADALAPRPVAGHEPQIVANGSPRPAGSSRWLGAGGALAVVVLVGFVVPDALAGLRWEHKDLRHERARTTEIQRLDAAIDTLGGYWHIRYCGGPAVTVAYASVLAWYTKLNVGDVGSDEQADKYLRTTPSVWFAPLRNGWVVNVYHEQASKLAACANLDNALYIVTPNHPRGFVSYPLK